MDGDNDTIAAIATAPGPSGIAVVRISGPDSLGIADRIFAARRGRPPTAMAGGTFAYGIVHRPDAPAREVDKAVLLVFRAPHSYTRQDVAEIQGHGGRASAARLLRAVLDAGARMAGPGEFTRRAFLNGRIDLVQAEAVADLVAARSERAAAAAIEQLDGRLSQAFRSLHAAAVRVAADLAATLDVEDFELPEDWRAGSRAALTRIGRDVDALLATWDEGHLLREGARVVICGPPNAGKSTLMNALLGRERSIVSEHPGTTRDTVEEDFILAGIPVRFVDTAGLRETECKIEQDGVKRSRNSISSADVVLYILDCEQVLTVPCVIDLEIRPRAGVLVLINKTDLFTASHTWPRTVGGYQALPCSAKTGAGLDEVLAVVAGMLDVREATIPHATVSERHRQVLMSVRAAIKEISDQIASERDDLIVVASAGLRHVIDSLGTVTGMTYTEELLDSIFSRFCVGK